MVRSFTKAYIIFFLFVFPLCAGSDEELFLRGNKFYDIGQYGEALRSYELISKKGRAVLYNIGNCYYYDDNYVQALIYWARARQGASVSECTMIDQNSKYLLKKMGRLTELPSGEWSDNFLDYLWCFCSLYILQLLFLLLWSLFIVIFYYYRVSKKLLCVILGILLIVASVLLYECYKKTGQIQGIIVQDKALLFSGPNTAFHQVGQLQNLDYVIIKETREGWHKIGYFDKIGWIGIDAVQII